MLRGKGEGSLEEVRVARSARGRNIVGRAERRFIVESGIRF